MDINKKIKPPKGYRLVTREEKIKVCQDSSYKDYYPPLQTLAIRYYEEKDEWQKPENSHGYKYFWDELVYAVPKYIDKK